MADQVKLSIEKRSIGIHGSFGSSEVELPKKAKFCKFDVSVRCFWNLSCDYVDFRGVVRVCGHHRNPLGRFTRRKAVSVLERGFNG